ncbi:MAG: thiamine diphosphokinase [Coriobacteriia bacterium]|nr:thiamine diphosphokinase [Coriobacteriia bacterium]
MKPDALIVGAAPMPGHEAFYRRLLAECRLVVAADAAGEWCVSLGRIPDVTIGDFDSAATGAQQRLAELGSRVVCVPADKDESDLDLCAREARGLGASQMTFTAAFTERPDHTLVAFGTVLGAANLGATVREPDWTGWVVGGPGCETRSIALSHGETFSVISPEGATGVSVQGGRYPLENGTLRPLSSLGLSNVATGNEIIVSVTSGSVLVLGMRA